MFFTYCKETGCVVIKSTEYPAKAFTLANNFDDHFNIIELDVNPNDYYGKLVKIQNNQPIVIGPMTEENLKLLCDDCPSPVK